MKQRLAIGIVGNCKGIERILSQEGIPLEKIGAEIRPEGYSAIALTKEVSENQLKKIRSYVSRGGALLTTMPLLKLIDPSFSCSKRKVKLIEGKGELFQGVGTLWLKSGGWESKSAGFGTFEDGASAIPQISMGNGFVIALPFDLEKAVLDLKSEPRAFTSPHLPVHEQSSVVSKGNLRRLVRNCILALHSLRRLPLIHKWYYPGNFQTLFSFRIDLDNWETADIRKTLDVCRANKFKATWFLNTENMDEHKGLAKEISKSQEVGSHLHLHDVFDSPDKNMENATTAHRKLSGLGINVRSAAAPFAKWNESFGSALEDMGYFYSSEFRIGYEDLPFRPIVQGKESPVLQIPVHPMSLGELMARNYTERMVADYFREVAKRLSSANEPVIFTGHPDKRLGRYPNAFSLILNAGLSLEDCWVCTMGEFAEWWRQRDSVAFTADYDGSSVVVKCGDNLPRLRLRVVKPDTSKKLVRYSNSRIVLSAPGFSKKDWYNFRDTVEAREAMPAGKFMLHKAIMAAKKLIGKPVK